MEGNEDDFTSAYAHIHARSVQQLSYMHTSISIYTHERQVTVGFAVEWNVQYADTQLLW